jgi:hypothetical protein
MSHNCVNCGHIFSSKDSLKKHINRKVPCLIKKSDNKSLFNCKDCNRGFKSNQGLKKHVFDRCPIIKNKKTEGKLIENMQNKIEVLSETVNELKSKLNNQLISKSTTTIGNNSNINSNNSNTTNNIQINNIIIPYGQNRIKESIILHSFLKDNTASQQYSKLPQSERYDNKNEKSNELLSSVLIEITENRYLDPENRNIYLCKKDKVMTYEPNETWRMKPLEIALREIVNDIVKTCKEMNRKIDYPEWVPVGYRVSIDESIPMMYENNSFHILKIAKLGLSTILESNKINKEESDQLVIEKISEL